MSRRGSLFVNLLGGFRLSGPRPEVLLLLERKKSRALLALLAFDPGQMIPRGKLTTVLWAEQDDDAARHALRQCLLDLRQTLGKANIDVLRVDADLIGLEPSRVIVDVARFERQVALGTPEALEEAAVLYRGDLLEGFTVEEPAFEDWLRLERERLPSHAVGALKKLLTHDTGERRTDAGIQVALRLLALEPFDEVVHRTLMRLYAESGRRSAALRQYEDCVDAKRCALRWETTSSPGWHPVTRQDLARLFPEIADGPAPAPGGPEDGPRIFEAVGHLIRQLAARHPLIVVIEDLHWCDDMTIRLLKFLPRRLEGQPVLLAGTARPEEMVDTARGRLFEALRQEEACASTTLRPLYRDEVTQLLRAVLPSQDQAAEATLATRVWTLSEGNPFVVIECARALRDRGAAGSASLELPDQVRALTARCFTDLGEWAARLGDVAAVIGRDFDVAVLRQAARATEQQLVEGLEELVRRRVLHEAAGRFDFRHDRVRELAYARLLGPRRALLHCQVARALEAIHASELSAHFATIGTHYRQAGVWTEACQYLARAGFLTWERGASREALACFEDALKAISRLPDTEQWRELHVHLRVAANGAHVATGNYAPGRSHLYEAEKLAPSLSDRRWEGRVAAALCHSLRAAGAYDRALERGRRALDIGGEIGDQRLKVVARYVLGQVEHSVGKFRPCLAYLVPLLAGDVPGRDFAGPFLSLVDRQTGLRDAVRHWIVLTYVELGEFQAGMQLVHEWLQLIDPDMLGTSRLTAYIALGRLRNAMGDFDEAVVAYETALASYREDWHGSYYPPLGWGLGLAYALAGRVRQGLDVLERAEAAERNIGSKRFAEMLLLHLARAYLKAGRFDDATRAAHEALTWAREHGDRAAVAGAHGLLAEITWLREPLAEEEMERHVTVSLALADELEMRPLAARCHLRLAWLYEKTGRADHERHAVAAASLMAEMGNPRSLDAAAVH